MSEGGVKVYSLPGFRISLSSALQKGEEEKEESLQIFTLTLWWPSPAKPGSKEKAVL